MDKTHLTIAVVDNDANFARAIGRLLRASGYSIATYASAEDFLLSTAHILPHCLVLDVQMGGMSGVELQQRLIELGNHTPIIFVTAHDSPENCKQALAAGCIAYLRKPVASRDLLAALDKALPPAAAAAASPA